MWEQERTRQLKGTSAFYVTIEHIAASQRGEVVGWAHDAATRNPDVQIVRIELQLLDF